MKIAIITVHNVGNNFGSALQSCALCEFLNLNGYSAQLIDYNPKGNFLSRARRFSANMIFLPFFIKRSFSFLRYFKEHALMTQKKYTSYNQLKNSIPPADVYIAGSDQIWNTNFPCGKDKAYYLMFTKSAKKIAYAASAGRILNDNEISILIQNTKDFKYISMREKQSCKQLSDAGRNTEHVLDPVFLLKKEKYLKNLKPNLYGKYLLVYAVDSDNLLNYTAKRIAEEYGLKIVLIGGFKKKCVCDVFLRSAGPKEFINLLHDSEFVLTSSYHGAAMSIILQKQFTAVLPKRNSLRIEDLLKTAGISDRIIRSYDDILKIKQPICFDRVNEKMGEMREQSMQYLLRSIERLAKQGGQCDDTV